MGWLFVLPALFGVWKYRYWAYWKPILWILLVLQLTSLLFSASGNYPNLNGDGLITGWLRWTSQDGPEVLFGLLGIAAAIGICVWLLVKAHKATRAPNPGPDAGRKTAAGQKVLESVGVIALALALAFAVGGVNSLWPQVIAPERYASPVSPSAAPSTIEAQLQEAARAIQPQLPLTVDGATTMTAVDAEGGTLVYRYQLSVDGAPQELSAFFNRTNLPSACADPDLSAAMKSGASFAYAYTMQSGRQQVLTLNTSACAAGKAIEG